MRKFKALYINELIKFSKKPLYIVLVILVSASMIFIGAIMGLAKQLGNSDLFIDLMSSNETSLENAEARLESNINSIRPRLENLQSALLKQYDAETGKFDVEALYGSGDKNFYSEYISPVSSLLYDLYDDNVNVARLKLEQKLGRSISFDIRSAHDYMFGDMESALVYSDANKAFFETRSKLFAEYPMVGAFDEQSNELSWPGDTARILTETAYDKYLKLCTENDVKGVFDYKREQLRNDESLSESEKNIQLASLDIMEDLYREDMSYDAWHEITESFSLRDMYKASLEKGTNSAGQKLTQSEIEEYSLAVAEIEQGMRVGAPGYGGKYTTNDKATGTVLIKIGTGLGQILVIMLGALIVAEDFQSGAIKTLIIAPVKRRRIVSAKFALLATVCLICALQVFVTYMIAALISGSDLGYNVFVVGHSVIALNPFLYYLFYILVSFVPVFFHGCFAFMLSTLIRNAGGSIAVSMGTVFMISGNAAVPMILSMMGSQAYFLKHVSVFLPASNLSLAESLFKSAVQNRSIGLMDVLTMNIFGQTGNGPLFSFLYLAVLSAVFIFISYQSYVKRDVK